MKILLINDFAEKIGGVEIYCYRLKNLHEKRGHEVIKAIKGFLKSETFGNMWYSMKRGKGF